MDIGTEIIKKFGPPASAKLADATAIEYYSKILPIELIEFWQAYGWGTYRDGLVTFCDPRPIQDFIDRLFAKVPDIVPYTTAAITYDCFGDMILWNKEKRKFSLSFNNNILWHDSGRKLATTYEQALAMFKAEGAKNPEQATTNFMKDEHTLGMALYSEIDYVDLGPVNEDDINITRFVIDHCGTLNLGEIYYRKNRDLPIDEAISYERMPLIEALNLYPHEIDYVWYEPASYKRWEGDLESPISKSTKLQF